MNLSSTFGYIKRLNILPYLTIALFIFPINCALAEKVVVTHHAPVQNKSLILDLPSTDLIIADQPVFGIVNQSQNEDSPLFIASGKKQTPINVNCNMNVFQTSAPEIPLASKLTGECGFKYRY